MKCSKSLFHVVRPVAHEIAKGRGCDLRSFASSTMAEPNQHKLPKIAVAQMTSTHDIEENYRVVSNLTAEASAAGASLLCLPENFHFLGRNFTESLAIAEPLDGPSIRRYADLAKEHNIMLSLGGFQEKGPDEDHLYNTHIILDSKGHIAARYRKIHLFDVDVRGGPVLMESRFTARGRGLATCTSSAGHLGLSTCYDLRFPQMYQRLAWEMGAQTLLVPSAFTVPTGKAHWEVLLRARAIENQVSHSMKVDAAFPVFSLRWTCRAHFGSSSAVCRI